MSEEGTSFAKAGRSMVPNNRAQAVLGTGAADIAAASKAVAAAAGSGTFAVDPAVVDSMLKKLLELQDIVSDVRRKSGVLSHDTKLGGGYAVAISQINKDFGQSATQHLKDVEREIESLRTQIEKSRDSYRNVDQTSSDSLKNLNGKS
ncbi:hypothetical protein [Lentzea aerocolonigenes]|uniref:hypothetical protein n=1 Tax=Lentzea aerocolonigenes TaxID=68170 RepID=UPI0012DCA04E|nr:hypothetical protein [Lentzea aerocolonigenes]